MPRRTILTAYNEEQIIAALTETPHASLAARKTGWSFSTVWRVAERAGIELTAGPGGQGVLAALG
jgi:hypothetical protein